MHNLLSDLHQVLDYSPEVVRLSQTFLHPNFRAEKPENALAIAKYQRDLAQFRRRLKAVGLPANPWPDLFSETEWAFELPDCLKQMQMAWQPLVEMVRDVAPKLDTWPAPGSQEEQDFNRTRQAAIQEHLHHTLLIQDCWNRLWRLRQYLEAGRMNDQPEEQNQTTDMKGTGTLAKQEIVFLGERHYQLGNGTQITVEDNEDSVLQAFLKQPSMNGTELVDKAGFADAPRVLRNLVKKYKCMFAPAIHLPGGKAKGGYIVAIRRNPS